MKKIFLAIMIALMCAMPVTAYAAEEASSEPLNVTEAKTYAEVVESPTNEAETPSEGEGEAELPAEIAGALEKIEAALAEKEGATLVDTLRDYLGSLEWLVDLLASVVSFAVIFVPVFSKIRKRLKKSSEALSADTKAAIEGVSAATQKELGALKTDLAEIVKQNGKLTRMLSTLASGTSTVSPAAKAVLAALAVGGDDAAEKAGETAEENTSFPALEAVAERVATRTVTETDVLNG